MKKTRYLLWAIAVFCLFGLATNVFAGEADIKIPDLTQVKFDGLGGVSGVMLMYIGILMCFVGAAFGLVQYKQTKALPVHKSMGDVSNTIWETCKTYLFQQGKFLAILWVLIAACIFFYFKVLEDKTLRDVAVILARFHPRHPRLLRRRLVRHPHQHRRQFPHLVLGAQGQPVRHAGHPPPLRHERRPAAGLRRTVLHDLHPGVPPRNSPARASSASPSANPSARRALRICGGIFTKIADIGSDLMKIVFKLPEDDPKNPGVIADCTGDNAGDSVGPTADGFETYGVTGVALIAFLALALEQSQAICATLIIWIFVMRVLMIATSLISYFLNQTFSQAKYGHQKDFDFEAPLTHLVWITSGVSILITFAASYFLLAKQPGFEVAVSGGCFRPSFPAAPWPAR